MLIGAVFGVGIILCNFYLADLVPQWLGYPPRVPWFDYPATRLLGVGSLANGLPMQIFGALTQGFMLLFFLFLLYVVLRKDRLAALALWALGASALGLSGNHDGSLVSVPFACLGSFLIVWVLYRYGLLASVSALFFLHLNIFFPITSDFSAWHAGDFLPALAVALALAACGCYTSLAGQPLFRGKFLED